MRQIVDINGLAELFPLTLHQIRHKVRDPQNPLPHKKCGKRLLFDVERVYKWFDQLPGRDNVIGMLWPLATDQQENGTNLAPMPAPMLGTLAYIKENAVWR